MKKRCAEEQIIRILQEAEQSANIRDVCRKHNITEQTFYRWRNKYGGLDVPEGRRLRALGKESAELKKMVAEQALDIHMLKDVNAKNGNPIRQSPRCGVPGAALSGQRTPGVPGIEASVGSRSDSYDNALAEITNGLYKTEVIRCRGLWRNIGAVEYATLERVDWFNHRRLLEPIGNIPPAGLEQAYYRNWTGRGHGGLTQTTGSPEDSGRFTLYTTSWLGAKIIKISLRLVYPAGRYVQAVSDEVGKPCTSCNHV